MPHVAGLRTLAIFLVIWFHFSSGNTALEYIPKLPYGFFGVDIFLVIMGYFLIKGFCKEETIKVLPYLAGKGSRLLPAMIVMILATMAAGVFIFDASDNLAMAQVGLAALYGWSNEVLRSMTSGYFAEDASMNPFLHTWYMSVTIQLLLFFYVGYRLMRWLPSKLHFAILFVVGIASFVYSQQESLIRILAACGIEGISLDYVPSYYSTLPRVWQLLAGGAILLLPECKPQWGRNLLAISGAAMMLVPAFAPEACLWSTAILVVPGTMLTIKYGQDSLLSPILSNKPMLWGGKISYSIYLVHMPILVLYKGWIYASPNDVECLALAVASVAIGYLLWQGVERRKVSWWITLPLWGTTFGLCYACVSTEGFKEQVNASANKLTLDYHFTYKYRQEKNKWFAKYLDYKVLEPAFFSRTKELINQPPLKRIGNPAIPANFIIIGDSHMYQTAIALDVACKEIGRSGLLLDSIVSPFWNRKVSSPGTSFYKFDRERANALFTWLSKHPELDIIVIAQKWIRFDWIVSDWDNKPIKENTSALIEFCKRVKALNKRVILVEPTPVYSSAKVVNYVRWLKRRGLPMESQSDDFICREEDYREIYKQALDAIDQMEREGIVSVLRLKDHFFIDGINKNISNGKVICGDKDHMTISAAQELGLYLIPQLPSILPPPPPNR